MIETETLCDPTWQGHALYLVRLAGVSLQFAFGHRMGFSQVEKREPVTHWRLFSLSRRSFDAATQTQIIISMVHSSKSAAD